MTKNHFLICIVFIIILVSACENRPILECPKPVECQKCPEKICPSCPSCEELKPQDKPLIVEYTGDAKQLSESDRHFYNTYRIINPNDRKVLVNVKTYCYDINNTENIYQTKIFIDAKYEFRNNIDGGRYFYANCFGDWHKSRIETQIID